MSRDTSRNMGRSMSRRATVAIETTVESDLWSAAPFAAPAAERAVATAVEAAGIAIQDGAELSVVLTDDMHIRRLNAAWRGRDQPTNVLSFPAVTPEAASSSPLLGDVVLAFETLEREAAGQGISLESHYVHLLVHGFLHLFGYDHLTQPEAAAMERLETDILRRLGFGDPYAGSVVMHEAS